MSSRPHRPPIPKLLLTPWGEEHITAPRLYVVRTRPHLLIVQLRISLESGDVTATRWPPLVPDLTAERLQNENIKLLSLLAGEMEIYGDLTALRLDFEKPPPILHLAEPEHDNEYLLFPHAPRLYRIHVNRHGDETGFTHVRGWGAPFVFGQDDPLAEMRVAAAFLRTHFGLRELRDPDHSDDEEN